ncbi:MAG: formyl transferase [Herpetosiphonaceae bacterium]|nr:formyl transferase [Herpetosiphonaceae bacterium]
MKHKIVMLAGNNVSTRLLFHALSQDFEIASVILEDGVPPATFIRRRIKKHGLTKVAGQILFQLLVVPYLKRQSRPRIAEIWRQFNFIAAAIPAEKIVKVDSVNSPATITLLQALEPDIVIVNGTRIIAKKVLEAIAAPFVNMHAGITPLYRGVHGGYWALVEHNPAACGVTIHLVDPGIDTGTVLGQALIQPGSADSFVTYPLLQLGAGIPLLRQILRDMLAGTTLAPPPPPLASQLRTHPSLWEYGWYRWRFKIK